MSNFATKVPRVIIGLTYGSLSCQPKFLISVVTIFFGPVLQRAWLLKLLALELHVSDIDIVSHRDSCRRLLAHLFLQKPFAAEDEIMTSLLAIRHVPADGLHKIKVYKF